MKKYCCIILVLALVLAGCSTAKPADSVSSTSETTETNLESISSNESTNPSAGEETSNANCYTIEEVANGAADGTVDEHGIEMFPEEAIELCILLVISALLAMTCAVKKHDVF